jgi:hypothetical protein|tara:strand:- start:2549 stop:2800 length:252 start_codon:yes stop_codon:yes gene_type:complete
MDFGIFSEYRDVLGKPKEGVHKYRFMNVAIVDYLLTIIGAFIIGYLTAIPVEIVTIILFSLGVILHLLFDVNTNTTKFLKGYV